MFPTNHRNIGFPQTLPPKNLNYSSAHIPMYTEIHVSKYSTSTCIRRGFLSWMVHLQIQAHVCSKFLWKTLSWCIISALADIMKKLLTKYDNLFEVSFPYSMGWHGECSVWIVVQSLRRINVPMFVYVSSNFNLQIPLTIQLLTL